VSTDDGGQIERVDSGGAAAQASPGEAVSPPAPIECSVSDGFAQWIRQAGGSLLVTTYQAGKVAVIGWDERLGRVSLLLRHFDKPMGIAASAASQPRKLALATRHAVITLADAPLLAPDYLEDRSTRYDALLLPRLTYHCGDLNVHDLAYDSAGTLWIANTRFSCLSHLSDTYSFIPTWRPPFVSEVVPEDRCHLNGLAMVDGKPGYVTCLGESDTVGGWREKKANGGVIVDVRSNEVVLRGLSMPHSPRWYKDQLWVLNSGLGELWAVDVQTGRHVVVCALPAYLRGLCFAGPYALVGMCQIRERHIFGGLPVQERHAKLLCGVAAVDLRSGAVAGLFEFTSGVQELFEVLFLPGVRRAMIVGPEKEQARQAFTSPAFSYWLRPSNEIREPDEATS
jgi:uncharacterized protein (TIGR03032 family)